MHEVIFLSTDEIVTADVNPKRHDIDTLISSIKRFGFGEPLLIDSRTKKLVAGHGRLEAIKQLKADGAAEPQGLQDWKVPVVAGWASKNDEEASAYLLASNKLVELGGWDDDELKDLLATISDLDGVGFDIKELEPEDITPLLEGDQASENEKENFRVIVTFPNEREQLDFLEKTLEAGYECQALL